MGVVARTHAGPTNRELGYTITVGFSDYRRLWFRLGRILTNLTYTRCAIVPRGRYWGPGAAAPVVIADRWLKCYTLCVPRRGGRVVEGGGLENR